jgi:DNA-binding beta-propeller fold protein YncE
MIFSNLFLALSLLWAHPFSLYTVSAVTTIPTENNTIVTRFTAATFNNHRGVSISSDGVFALVANTYNHVIHRITLSTMAVTTLAGFSGSTGATNGFGTVALFHFPYDMSIAPTNDYALVADSANYLIRHIILTTAQVTTFAGSVLGDMNGIGTNAQLGLIYGIAISPDGLYALYTDNSWSTIRKVVIATKEVMTFAGSGSGTSSQFLDPYGIAISSDGSFALVAEGQNCLIRRILMTSGEVTTLAGTAQSSGSGNGFGTNVLFNNPNGVSISPGGDYALVTDTNNHVIRLVIISTGQVSTIAGVVGSIGTSNGMGTNVHFNSPRAVAISLDGNFALVADSWNGYLRNLQLPLPPTSFPTFTPSRLPTISPLPTSFPVPLPSPAPTELPSPVPTATPSTPLPTSSPTLGPIFMRNLQCKASPLEPFNPCSFVLCPNQELVFTLDFPSPSDDYYYSTDDAPSYGQSFDENVIHGAPMKNKLHSRSLSRPGPLSMDDDSNTQMVVKLLDSKGNVIQRYSDGYEFHYTYDVSSHFCDVMTLLQKCTMPESCPFELGISIFQSRDVPTLPKFSFGLIFNDTEHASDLMEAPAISYFFDKTRSECASSSHLFLSTPSPPSPSSQTPLVLCPPVRM